MLLEINVWISVIVIGIVNKKVIWFCVIFVIFLLFKLSFFIML